jgi:glycosyltransferase involved in cell wall biosynthesis
MFDPKDTYQRIGSPNKLFEAMVCGRPILVSRGTFVGELVNKEKCGLVVPYTKNDLKDAIVRLRDDSKLRETLGRNALNAAIRRYNWEKESEKLIEIYGQILMN